MSDRIYVRACLIVLQADKILFVPHFETDAGPIQYNLPGGEVEFGEALEAAALREFEEETGLTAVLKGLFDIYEHRIPDYHSITIAYLGTITGGTIRAEQTRWGNRMARWFSAAELADTPYHPRPLIEKVFATMGAE